MKNLLKITVLLSLIAMLLYGCSEDIYENTHTENYTINYQEFKKVTKINNVQRYLFQKIQSKGLGKSNKNINQFYIDTTYINQYTKGSGDACYSFRIYPNDTIASPNIAYNLVLNKINAQWETYIYKINKNPTPINGKSIASVCEEFKSIGLPFANSQSRIGITFIETVYTHCTNSGKCVEKGYCDLCYLCTTSVINIAQSYTEEENVAPEQPSFIMNIGGSTGGGPAINTTQSIVNQIKILMPTLSIQEESYLNQNPDVASSVLGYLQTNSTIESQQFVKEFIIQCINNPNLHLDFEASLKSPSFVDLDFDVSTPEGAKLKEVNDALMTSSEFRRLFYNLFSEIPQLSVKLTIGNIDQSNAVGYIYGNCHSVYNTNSLYMYNEITIDRQGLLTKSKMNIALFVLHEYIHAYLNVKFRKPPIGFSISQINSMDFVNCVNTYYNGFSGAQSQHIFFVDFMIPTIVEILSDIKNILITSQEASQIENPIDGGAILYQPMNGNPLTPSDIQIPWNWNTFLYYFSYQGLQNCSAFPFSIYPNLITSGDYYYHWYNGCYNTIFNP